LGLYTCSYPEEILDYVDFFKNHRIDFELINKNEKEKNTIYGYFNDKPYFNVLIDDKAGFDAENDWTELRKYLINRRCQMLASLIIEAQSGVTFNGVSDYLEPNWEQKK